MRSWRTSGWRHERWKGNDDDPDIEKKIVVEGGATAVIPNE